MVRDRSPEVDTAVHCSCCSVLETLSDLLYDKSLYEMRNECTEPEKFQCRLERLFQMLSTVLESVTRASTTLWP